jgi:hypothetical protein
MSAPDRSLSLKPNTAMRCNAVDATTGQLQ